MAEASAPASSANLGPGFDTLALALDIRCTVVAERASAWSVRHHGLERPAPDAGDAVLEAARIAVGTDRPLRLAVDNHVPVGRGLGSSAAAYAAGALAAWRAVGEEHPPESLFELVTAFEGHPDNAAATVFGGLVLTTGDGRVHRLPWNPVFRLIVAVPDRPFATREAREVLPVSYPADAVVRSNGRVAALVSGLLTGDESVLASAGGDEIHEEPRSRVRPDVAALVQAARSAGAAHAAWSGAGPSVLALATDDHVEGVVEAFRRRLEGEGRVLLPAVATSGAV